jgi:serine/threonine-protein kinase
VATASVQIVSGTSIGPYVVERKLAQGGMSVLFLAHDTQLDRPVALKMLGDDAAPHATRARLLREARTLAAVDHPGIVRIYGAGEHEGHPWIAMELVRGTDLKRLLAERGPVPPARALRWILQAADALAAAHDVGVVHRDLKPSNLLLTHEDKIKVVDFGVAKRRMDPGATDVLTTQGETVGTPAYLSPEQLEHGLADERSDVWGLGCVLYELCAGSPPFGRANSAATTASILRDEPVIPASMGPVIADVITACLRKSSFARVASMRELAAIVRDALEHAPPGASVRPPERPSSSIQRAVRPSVRPSVGPASSSSPPSTSSLPAAPVADVGRTSELPPPPSRASVAPMSRPSTARPFRPSQAPLSRASSQAGIRAHPRGHMKGTAVRTGLLWYAQRYGAEAIARAAASAPASVREMLRLDEPTFGIVPSGWYDTRVVGELLLALERAADVLDDEAYNNALADAIAKDNVGGVYRSLFRLITTPSMLEANAQRVWRTYCDEGTLLVRAPRPGELSLEIRHWTHHHPQTCRLVGFAIQHLLRAVGYEALVVERTMCLEQGDPVCAFEGVYLPK